MQYAARLRVLFLHVVQSVVCSTYLFREVDISAGQLACRHNYQGMLPQDGLSTRVTPIEYAYP